MTRRDIAEMLQSDRDEWERLVQALDTHPGGPVHDPESPQWEARHVYAHLARWINNSMDDFEAVIEGRPRPAPPKGDDDEINARWRAEDAGIDLTYARALAHVAYERRLRLIEAVRDDRWSNLLMSVANADGHRHYAGHRLYIESSSG